MSEESEVSIRMEQDLQMALEQERRKARRKAGELHASVAQRALATASLPLGALRE